MTDETLNLRTLVEKPPTPMCCAIWSPLPPSG